MTLNDHDVVWDVVRRSPLTSGDRHKRSSLGMTVVNETKNKVIGKYRCDMVVEFNFFFLADVADVPDEVAARVIAGIHKRVHAQVADGGVLDGLAWNATESSNESLIDGFSDRQIEGRVFFTYQYTHKVGDQTAVR